MNSTKVSLVDHLGLKSFADPKGNVFFRDSFWVNLIGLMESGKVGFPFVHENSEDPSLLFAKMAKVELLDGYARDATNKPSTPHSLSFALRCNNQASQLIKEAMMLSGRSTREFMEARSALFAKGNDHKIERAEIWGKALDGATVSF